MSGQEAKGGPEYDVMISYSHDDSKTVAKALYDELTAYGWEVWWDEVELEIGDSIRESIDNATSKSEHAVILISPSYFEGMSEWELDGLVQRHNKSAHNLILPLLHKMKFEELQEESPSLANIIGEEVTEENVPEVTAKLHSAIENSGSDSSDGLEDVESVERAELTVSMDDLLDISKGSKVTIEEWRTSGTPHNSSIRGVEIIVEDSGLTYTGNKFIGRTKVIKNEALEGHVSNISRKSSGKTKFTLRIPQSRLNELSDDRDDYQSAI